MIRILPPSFRSRATIAFATYAFAVVLVVIAIGHSFNERVEESVWNTMLQIEIEQLEVLRQLGPDADPSKRIRTYVQPNVGDPLVPVPPELDRLRAGFHDDVLLDDRVWAVLVQEDSHGKVFLAFDITQLEADEEKFQNWGLIGIGIMLALLTALGYVIAGRVVAPVLDLAREVAARNPDEPTPLTVRKRSDLETTQIATAIDGYLSRIDSLLRREKEFLAAVSHELRTPIAVISGASDVLHECKELPESVKKPLERIDRAANDAGATLTVLLFLAREDEKKSIEYESCRVDKLILNLVSDHEHLLNERQQIRLGNLESMQIHAPARLVSIALGNVLRNAIQHGQSGPIDISLQNGTFTVTDVGPGIPEDTISQLTARQEHPIRTVSGYGLYIVQRIAMRLGWQFTIKSEQGKFTSVSLQLREESQKDS